MHWVGLCPRGVLVTVGVSEVLTVRMEASISSTDHQTA